MEAPHMPRSAEEGGCALNFSNYGFLNIIVWFLTDFKPVWGDFGHFWRILSPFDARSWGEVGSLLPTSSLYKPKALEAKRRFITGKWWRIEEPKPFLCREAIEESNFAGHFRELHSFVFTVVSFDGFLRYGRTQPDHFVKNLELLWCTFEALKRNKKASSTETKARRRRQDCRTLLSTLMFMVCCFLCSFPYLYMFNGFYVSSLIILIFNSFLNSYLTHALKLNHFL